MIKEQVYNYLKANPAGKTPTEIGIFLGYSKQNACAMVSHSLRTLETFGLIDKSRQGRTVLYGAKNSLKHDVFHGNRIKLLRYARGLSIRQLSLITKLSNQNLRNYERGVTFPSDKSLKMLCDFFGVNDRFFYEESITVELIGKEIKVV